MQYLVLYATPGQSYESISWDPTDLNYIHLSFSVLLKVDSSRQCVSEAWAHDVLMSDLNSVRFLTICKCRIEEPAAKVVHLP